MSGHTPAPWRIDYSVTAISIRPAAHDGSWRDPKAPTIATISLGYNPKHRRDEKEANARLIAASPDLLQLAIQYRDDLLHPPSDDSRDRRLQWIGQVLSKVEGSRAEPEEDGCSLVRSRKRGEPSGRMPCPRNRWRICMILAAAIGTAFGLGFGIAGFPARFMETMADIFESAHEGGQ